MQQTRRRFLPCLTLTLATAVATSAPAQRPIDAPPPPIRDHGTDPVAGPLGAWTANDTCKYGLVGDALVVVPYLGRDAPRSLPWTWRTLEAVVGTRSLDPTDARTTTAEGLRFALHRGAMTETWDVRGDGIEQRFVFEALPARDAELIVRGRIDGPLTCAPRASRHAPLTFGDPDHRIALGYGAAFAFDAAGRTCDVATAFVDGVVELRVPAAFVAAASLPLTIDPLVTVWVTASGTLPAFAAGVTDIDVDQVTSASRQSLIETEVRWASATDSDLFVRRTRDDFAVSTVVYSDASTGVAVSEARVAGVDPNGAAVVAWARNVPGGDSSVWWFLLHADATSPTVVRAATRPTGTSERSPRIGGRSGPNGSGATALLVRERTDGAGTSEIWGSVLDATNGSEGTPFLIAGSGQFLVADHVEPWVSRSAHGAQEPWLVAYQTWADLDDHWKVSVRRVRPDGTLTPGTFTPELPAGSPHAMRPRVEGSYGRYLLTFATASRTTYPGRLTTYAGTAIHAQRFDWQVYADGNPVVAHPRVPIASSASRALDLGGLGHDHVTTSHWAMSYGPVSQQKLVARLGYHGRPIETAALPGPSTGTFSQTCAAIAFDPTLESFPLVYGVRHTTTTGALWWRTYGGHEEHPALVPPTILGANCGPIGATQSRFRIGAEFPAVAMLNGPRGRNAVCLFSLGTASLPLANYGIGGGCTVQVDPFTPHFVVAVAQPTDLVGSARIVVPLAEELGPFDVYAQWLVESATVGELAATAGMRIEVR